MLKDLLEVASKLGNVVLSPPAPRKDDLLITGTIPPYSTTT